MFKKIPPDVLLLPAIAVYAWFALAPDLEYFIETGDWVFVIGAFLLIPLILVAVLIPTALSNKRALTKFVTSHPHGVAFLTVTTTQGLVAASTAHPGDSPIEQWRGLERRVLIVANSNELSLWRWQRKSPLNFINVARIPRNDVIGLVARRQGTRSNLCFAIDSPTGPLEFALLATAKSGFGASQAVAEEQVIAIRDEMNL